MSNLYQIPGFGSTPQIGSNLPLANTATATPPSSTSTDIFKNVDQQALNLTHAIALTESGGKGKPNYGAVGDNGTSTGAYQWNGAGHFAAEAKNAGLDPNDFSPENQDKVAYATIKKWKDQGLQPAEIASKWNSGQPQNWQNHSGTTTINGKTINYDTPGYVQKVKENYQKLSATNQAPQGPGYLPVTPVTPSAPINAPDPNPLATQQSQNSSELFRGALATGIRDIQAVPELATAVYQAAVDPATWGLLFHHPLEFLKQGLAGTPDQGSATDKANQIMAAPTLGANTLSGESNEQALGQGGEALSYLPTGMGSLLRGGLFGGGNAMEQNKGVTDVATQAGESALLFKGLDIAAPFLGKLAGSVIPTGLQDAASKGLEKIQSLLGKTGEALSPALDKVVPDFVKSNKNVIQQGAEKIFGKQFIQGNVDSWNEIFTGTKAAKKNLLNSLDRGKDDAGFLGTRGIMPSIDTSGGTPKWNAQPAIAKVEALAQPYNDAVSALSKAKDSLMSEADKINLDDLAAQAKAKINTSINRGAGNIPAMEKQVDDEINNLKSIYGDKVNASQLDEIRKGQWKASTSFKRIPNPTAPFKGDVHFQLGSVAKNIEGKILPEVSPLLDTLSDHYSAIGSLSKIDGNAVKNGRPFLQKMSNKLVGALIGSLGGPVGAIAGDVVGGMASDVVNNFALKNPLKVAVLKSIPEDSALYDAAQATLKKMQGQIPLAQVKNGFLQLPAPAEGSAKFGGGEPIKLPGKGFVPQYQADINAQNAPRSTFKTIKPTYKKGGGKITQIFGEP